MNDNRKPNSRRNLLLRAIPFTIPIAGMNLTVEPKANAQDGSGPAILAWLKEFAASYESFQKTFKDVQKEIGSYYNAYDTVKKGYDVALKTLEREAKRFNSFHNMNTIEKFLDAEMGNLSAATDAILNVYSDATEPFERLIASIRKEHPKKSTEVMTPKEEKYHLSREARSRHTLGRTTSSRLKERAKSLKMEVGKEVKDSKDKSKSAAEVFSREAGPVNLDTLQNIDETLLRLEAVMIAMTDKLNGVETKPKKFETKQWVKLLKSFRKGNGTLTEV